MSGVASAIGAVASVGSAAIGASAAKKAGKKQAAAADAASAQQQQQLDLINQQNAPYREAGTAALNQLMGLYGLNGQEADYSAFENSPDYQFAQQQGEQSLLRNRAALGGLQGGQTGAALQQYGQGLASQQLGNYRNSLMGLVNTGQGANQLTAQAGLNTGQAIGQNMQNAGNASAAGTLASSNALIGGLGGLANAAGDYFQSRSAPKMGTTGGGGIFAPNAASQYFPNPFAPRQP
jgi:hypothetical protein